ncbi:MAG: CerR family C-terminal domain-containing protein [Bryobacteraceae bacterium]|jgi:TetR/AcrR family transcriptional regulator, regulator of cefoperazone and chloramphenicol sensitivity
MASRTTHVRNGAAGPSSGAAEDTRTKLLDAAAEIFAELGYHRATIREICARAGVNGALVNYHFGDKLELYAQTLQRLVSVARLDAVRAALNQKAPPETILREAIKARLRGVAASDHSGWLFRIVAHEMTQPTPAMTHVVNSVLRPLYNQVYEIAGALIGLPAADEQTRLCAHSVMGQVIIYAFAGPVLARLWPDMQMTPENLDRIANHITDFSLAYLRQVRGAQPQTGGT